MGDRTYKQVKLVLWLILVANFIVAALKLSVGLACKSQSVVADGIHSFSDGSSNVVGLIGIRLSSKPSDKKHPYGHMKYEIIASLFIGIMLAFMAMQIMSKALASLNKPAVMEISLLQGILMSLTIFINIIVASTEFLCGKKLKSTILVTDSLHTRGDIFVSCTVLIGVAGIRLGIPVWIDTIMSIGVALVVLGSAWQITKNCVDVLVDSVAVDTSEIEAIAMAVPGVCGVHHVRSRGGMSQVFIDMHVITCPDENICYGHCLSHRLEQALKEHYGQNTEVNIHVEPDDGLHNKE